jgi:hypothetical protein
MLVYLSIVRRRTIDNISVITITVFKNTRPTSMPSGINRAVPASQIHHVTWSSDDLTNFHVRAGERAQKGVDGAIAAMTRSGRGKRLGGGAGWMGAAPPLSWPFPPC